ncbi:TPA: fimbria/pilus outer membrane usher protein [Stenotrophomonas maltophilia]
MNRSSTTNLLRPHRLALAVLIGLAPAAAMGAPALEFNSDLLYGTRIDVSRFERDGMAPGTYSADISVNGTIVGRRDVEVRDLDGTSRICLTPELLAMLGLDAAKVDAARNGADVELLPMPEAMSCEDISRFIPSAFAGLDVGEQILEISIPQAYMSSRVSGWVDPERWDNGINALLLNYSVSHNRFNYSGQQTSRTSGSIDAGLNLGAWRVRHNGYFVAGQGTASYTAGTLFAQREIRRWNAQLTIGEAASDGDLFGSVSYRGVNLSTDPRMLPDSLNSYAPVVRGTAQTNARITIRQRGRVIYETTVAPGPFEIDNLTNMASGGDLEVEVTEADGRVETFVVPFAALPKLLRQGQQRFSVTAGELRDANPEATRFAQATYRRGMGSAITAYGGALASDSYHAVLFGAALNTRIGAFSGDVTFSDTRLSSDLPGFGNRMSGQSYRLGYSRTFNSATSFSLAAYRYSTEGYLSFSEAARLQAQMNAGASQPMVARQRSRLDLTVSQRLAKGSVYLQGSSADYWSDNRRSTTFSAGYSGQLGPASYNLSARRSMESSLFGAGGTRVSTSVNLSIQVPLGRAPSAPRLSASAGTSGNGGSYRAGVEGQFGGLQQGNYNVSYGNDSGLSEFGVGVGYRASAAALGASWTQSDSAQQLGISASGSVLMHAGGMALSLPVGETVGLLHVPGAAGAAVGSQRGVKTNSKGYAIVPYLSAYRLNEVSVDPKGLPMDVELKTGSVTAVPTAGAVVKMVVPTSVGRSALIEAMDADGAPLPFGLDVYNETGEIVGVVGQGSRLWVRGIEESGRLLVNAGENGAARCAIHYDLSGAGNDEVHVSKCLRSELDGIAEAKEATSAGNASH